MSAGPTDQARWRAAGKPETMTIEQRADFIACAMLKSSIGGTVWRKVRDRALEQLRQVTSSA